MTAEQKQKVPWFDPAPPTADQCVNSRLIDRFAAETPDKVFIRFETGETWTWAETRIKAMETAAALQAKVKPIYEEMPGWSESTAGARSWAELPAQAIKYIRRIEELIECPVTLVSTSPQRDDTILVTDPFAD